MKTEKNKDNMIIFNICNRVVIKAIREKKNEKK